MVEKRWAEWRIKAASWASLKALRDEYRAKGVEVLLIDSNLTDTSAAIAKAAADQGIDMPITDAVARIIDGTLDVKTAIGQLMTRPITQE